MQNNEKIPTNQNVDVTAPITVEQVKIIDALFLQMHEININFKAVLARLESIEATNSDTVRMVYDVKCEILHQSNDFYSLFAWFEGLKIDFTRKDYEEKHTKLEQTSVDVGVRSKMVGGQECFHISVFESAFTVVPCNF